jgi:hypothetical protein
MTKDQHRLLRHIWFLIALKLLALFLLWWFFIRGQKVPVDEHRTTEHFAFPTSTQTDSYSNQEKGVKE